MDWVNLHCKTTGSLSICSMTIEQMVARHKQLGYSAVCMMDYGSISLAYELQEECKKAGVKPIYGLEAFVSSLDSHITDESNRRLTRIGIISKNLKGTKALFKAVSQSNRNFYKKPRLALDEWAAYADGNWIIITGWQGTELSELPQSKRGGHLINLIELFGRENVYVGIQAISETKKNVDELRVIADLCKVKCVAIADSHYAEPEDSADQRVLLCSLLGTKLTKVKAHLDSDEAKDIDVARFFESNAYYVPELSEIQELHKGHEVEIANAVEIANKCETYSLSNNPILPEFKAGLDAYEELTRLCRIGWKELLNFKKEDPRYEEYRDRIKDELRVIKDAGLANYFLIVADICDFARKNDILMGVGRGSSGGCLISYLTGITKIDPIPYGLMFSRFFDESRKNSLPDIDLDFQPSRRQDIFNYIMDKYGLDKTAKISTFSRVQGRGAIRLVLTVHEACDFITMGEITKYIPDEGKIADELQELSENDHENAKVLYWAVVNNAAKLAPWVKLESDGSYSGEFGKYFAQAIRLEGLYKNTSEHASGIIVTPGNIDEYCPLIKSKHGLNAGMPYPDLEGMGLPKFDILGINVLDKLKMILTALRTGDIYGDTGNSFADFSSDSREKNIIDNDKSGNEQFVENRELSIV